MKHTPLPPNSFQLDCGCTATNTGLSAGITYCPLHRAAPELVEVLKQAQGIVELGHVSYHFRSERGEAAEYDKVVRNIRAVISNVTQ